ncbi:D-malate degradation protein R [Serratia quinivorans]|jgi:DNA-binding transcriptional LysR family regulator|uniref:LysR family transcriptional regulator n=1 Tax=Serratia quinivorans TaxID=137545 RepID=UPI0021782FA2|nr:LysR family transcriptional regulator [Serratia quinivorans]CAI1112378.1 D-malate degradation protein R [Serratia quinivorans]CAI1226803.1 D-malate degradation protein R [Serratia quinivorans]CAI1807596.1 D-malate degradation protein R [Serratia quinivorans]CAI1948290.1 D-malate degradation protein R [Serratia quinivorans]CAI2118511.1 D-malate degradation protein R [Serratia quinivorans]
MDQIQAMRIFTRIVELGSFSRAAERLQLPRATVSNALKRLEQRLGVRLLIRTTRQVQVTSEGTLYYQRCVQLLGALEEADTLFSHHKLQPSGKVRIDMPHSLAREIVIPALDDFYQRYPDLTLALGANDTNVDLLREGVDCVLRAWETEDDSLVARRIAMLPQLTCASPAYLATFGVPQSIDQLQQHQTVGYFSLASNRNYPLEFCRNGKVELRELPARLSVSGADAYTSGCRAGMGLIQAAHYSLAPWLQKGELVEVLAETPPPPMPIYIMYPPGRFLAPRVRVLIDWLIWLFEQYQPPKTDVFPANTRKQGK